MRFSIESGKRSEKVSQYADRGSKKAPKEANLKENREIKTSINKFSDYYQKKQANTKPNGNFRINSNKK